MFSPDPHPPGLTVAANDADEERPGTPLVHATLSALPEEPAQLERFYRWGWLPLVAGCAAIIFGAIVVWEIIFVLADLVPPTPLMRAVLILRAASTATVLAIFVFWYVMKIRRRMEAISDDLRAEQAALRELTWRTEQVLGLGAMARVLAHEIRSPLHRIALRVAVLQRAVKQAGNGSPLALRVATELNAEIDAIDHLVTEYIDHTGQPARAFERNMLDAASMVASVVERERHGIESQGMTVELALAVPGPQMIGDVNLLRHAIQVLLRNAVNASPLGGRVRVECLGEGGTVRIAVADGGAAFDDAGSVFRPFLVTPRPGTSGLGMAIVRDVVRAHGGEVIAENLQGGGARIELKLPRGVQ